jgi:outer membrane protein assembly factor BamA
MRRSLGILGALLALWVSVAQAIEELEAEENIAELLPAKFPGEAPAPDPTTRTWALLPQFGYGPDTSALFGIKYAERNLLRRGPSVDVDATYALKGQEAVALSFGLPHLERDRWLLLLRAKYLRDPQREFFGIGNNEVGPNPLSTHEFQDLAGALTLGWRPFERLAFNFGVGLRQVDIRRGDRKDGYPFTPDLKLDGEPIPGVEGGVVNPLLWSLVWNTRDDVMRPTRGWRIILKIILATHAFSDFKFRRYIADGGYLRAFDHGRYVFGVRVNGEWVDARKGEVPFWELSELGGHDTLRGFFPYRFLGKGRVLLNGELRGRLAELTFRDLWRVKLDGVLFGDGGRVFVDREDVEEEFGLDEDLIDRVLDDFQYSYGCGLRLALAQAIVARVDVGFSDEETALVYLSFGHTF